MESETRHLRADAVRNRERLIAAATEMFSERGLDVSVGEIARRAGVGRATLFRNFCSKEALTAAVVAERLRDSVTLARARLTEPDGAAALFGLLDDLFERLQTDRALFQALDDTWMAHPEIRAAHEAAFEVLEELVVRAQTAGAVRADVSGVDVLLMFKGVCEMTQSFRHIDPEIPMRQLDLVKAAITAPGVELGPLRGHPPTAEALDGVAVPPTTAAAASSPPPHPG